MKKEMFYAECPDHGTAPALTRTETRYTRGIVGVAGSAQSYTVETPIVERKGRDTKGHLQYIVLCPSCKKWVTARMVKALNSSDAASYGHGCDGRCTGGKTTCECKCRGLCHGRGECVCAGAA